MDPGVRKAHVLRATTKKIKRVVNFFEKKVHPLIGASVAPNVKSWLSACP